MQIGIFVLSNIILAWDQNLKQTSAEYESRLRNKVREI